MQQCETPNKELFWLIVLACVMTPLGLVLTYYWLEIGLFTAVAAIALYLSRRD